MKSFETSGSRVATLLAAVIMLLGNLQLQAQTPKEWKQLKGDVTLYMANDLGRNGYYDQKPIAEQVYSHPELMLDWFPVLGNHEYRGNTQAVLDYSKVSRRWMMPARYYTKVFEDNGTTIRIVFLDTTPLIDRYRENSAVYPDACKQDRQAQLLWLDSTLKSAREDWVVVVGHHPIYAYTTKAEYERTDMQKNVMPILHKYNNVAIYACGHIHNFQHIRMPNDDIEYVVNSSASLARPVEKTQGTVFCSSADGFSIISASKKTLKMSMIDKDGKVIHTIEKTKK